MGAEDWEFFATAMLRGHRLETSLQPLFWYRVSASGMAIAGDWWSDYRRALRAYEALLPPALRELPALAGMLWRDANRAEQESRNLEAELGSRNRRLAELTEHAGRVETELAARDRHLTELGDHARNIETELAARDRHLAELGDHARHIEAELASRDRHLAELGDHARRIEAELLERDRAVADARANLVEATTREKEQAEHLRQTSAALTEAEHLARHFEAESGALRSQLNGVLESTSWRVTWPLRRALVSHPRTARAMRRGAKLAWWTVTLQLPRRIAATRRELEPRTGPVLSLPTPDPDHLSSGCRKSG